MVTIFRVEGKEFQGPYETYVTGLPGDVSERHPDFWMDGLEFPDKHEKCGFDSMEKLLDWFGDYLDVLSANGFNVVQIETEEMGVEYGHKQLIFDDVSYPNPRTLIPWMTVHEERNKRWRQQRESIPAQWNTLLRAVRGAQNLFTD